MELKGHNLIIISLDSHFSKMERNVLTRCPLPQLPRPPQPCVVKLEDSDGLQQPSAATTATGPLPACAPPRPGGSSGQSLEASAQISAYASQVKSSVLGSLGKTTLLSAWLLTAGGVKSSTQCKPRPAEPCPTQGPRRPLGSKGFENVLSFSSLFIFQCLMILSMQGPEPQLLLTIKEVF